MNAGIALSRFPWAAGPQRFGWARKAEGSLWIARAGDRRPEYRESFRAAVLKSFHDMDREKAAAEVWPILLVSFGGICAQRRYCGSAAAAFEHFDRHDCEQREALARAACGSDEEARTFLALAAAETARIIDHSWNQVLLLAGELALCGQLDAARDRGYHLARSWRAKAPRMGAVGGRRQNGFRRHDAAAAGEHEPWPRNLRAAFLRRLLRRRDPDGRNCSSTGASEGEEAAPAGMRPGMPAQRSRGRLRADPRFCRPRARRHLRCRRPLRMASTYRRHSNPAGAGRGPGGTGRRFAFTVARRTGRAGITARLAASRTRSQLVTGDDADEVIGAGRARPRWR